MFAGIWDYSDVKGDTVPPFAILTDEPNELVAPLGPDAFEIRPVNRAVNKVSEKNIEATETPEGDDQ